MQDSAPPSKLMTGEPTDFVSEHKPRAFAGKFRAKLTLFLILSSVIIALDQVTKYFISANKPQTELVPGFLNLVYVRNSGAVFGLFHSHAAVFVALSILASIAILVFLYYFPPLANSGAVAFALVLSGVVGNLIDRIRFGYVTDFISFHVRGFFWPAFNVADAALVVGVFVLIYYFYRLGTSRKADEHGLKNEG